MRLADFIRGNLEPLAKNVEDYAHTLPAGRHLTKDELRDHAKKLLIAIAEDLCAPQTEEQGIRKSRGEGPQSVSSDELDAISSEHSKLRFSLGFSIEAMVSEYRALRAVVLKQWQESLLGTDGERLADMMRFNEAIDQSVQSAVVAYTAEKERRIRLLEQMLSSMPDHSCIFDLEGRFIYVNQSLAEQIGKSSHEILGKNLFDLGIASAEVLHRQIEGVIYSKQPHRAETSGKSSELQPRYFEYILAPVVDPQGRVEAVTGTARDITERKMLDVEIWHKANYDALTGLPNRRLFRDRFEHEIKHAERTGMPLALMFIDLDRFKEINDTLGHEAGDLLLKQAGERLQACVREADTVARLGGDEFTVILADTSDGEHIRVVAEKILWELDRPFPLTQKSAHVSGSIGITLFPEDADTPTDLLRHADQAMYAAKNAGRGRYCFFSESTHR